MILNEVMGWRGYHLFEFEFYHQELRIIEGADDFDLIGPYDLGDDWQHRVTVEKMIEITG